jgi:hypothetical protein
MTWAFTGSAAYAWAVAGLTDPVEVVEAQAFVAGVPDGRIEDALVETEGSRRHVFFARLGEHGE